MYAQEGSFFIIPGPWFNHRPQRHVRQLPERRTQTSAGRPDGKRDAAAGQSAVIRSLRNRWTSASRFLVRLRKILPAEICRSRRMAWKNGVGFPTTSAQRALTGARRITEPAAIATVHGRNGTCIRGRVRWAAMALVYDFDDRAIAPYSQDSTAGNFYPLRPNPNFANLPLSAAGTAAADAAFARRARPAVLRAKPEPNSVATQ